jgi:threonine dehydrogenase-like Zn-dependent dehydrogenase
MPEGARRPLEIAPAENVVPPKGFERIAIVGLGLIGGSVALAARRANASVFIAGVDSPEALRQAVERGLLDVASERLNVVADADLVILAARVLQNIRLIPQVARCVSAKAIVTDVGSTVRPPAGSRAREWTCSTGVRGCSRLRRTPRPRRSSGSSHLRDRWEPRRTP